MASKIPIHLILLLIIFTLSLLPAAYTSWSSEKERDNDFMRWVSWNVEKHRRTSALRPNSIPGSGLRDVEQKQADAEEQMVRYIVNQDGSGDYTTIREAIDSISLPNKRRVVLDIKPGIYREKIVIPKSMAFITFLGSGETLTVITGNDTAASRGSDGKPLSTFHSATVAINADYFLAANIRFENTATHGPSGAQAVAVRVSGDKAAFYNCGFYGTQDTLYDHRGLHYFNNCFIQGSVDSIFGYGRSLYDNCYLNSIAKKVASLTAQRSNLGTMESGFSFTRSTINGSGLVYLGRAWDDHSRVVFSYTFMDKVVIPQGWNNWHIKQPEASGIYYGEYQCSGPGANWTGRVRWARQLTDEEAQPFLGTYYVNGDSWLVGPPSA